MCAVDGVLTLYVLKNTLCMSFAMNVAAVIRKKVEKKTHEEDLTGEISMKATDQLQLTDYVLKYYEDDDFEETTTND